ncbi:MAG TPA: hypothetical protein V6C97_33660 [Oculatellaceae cyanobacterium]
MSTKTALSLMPKLMNRVKSLNRQTLGCREILRKSSAVCTALLLSQYASGVFADAPDEPVEQQNMNQPAAVENTMPPPVVDVPIGNPATKAPFSLQVESSHTTGRYKTDVNRTDSRFFLKEQSRRLLSHFRLELIVDHSLSMSTRDCPGGHTRWNWCGGQAEDLALAIAPYSKNGITITPFAWSYEVYENASAESIERLFKHQALTPTTRLSGPLKDRLDYFFTHRDEDQRPLLLVVITDGLPAPMTEPIMVRHVLAAATKKIQSPGEVAVVFLQIGNFDLAGKAFLHSLEKKFGSAHFRPPFVQTIPFQEIQVIGLGNALVEAVGQRFPNAY